MFLIIFYDWMFISVFGGDMNKYCMYAIVELMIEVFALAFFTAKFIQ